MSNQPLISVIIPCYNQAHYLSEAIESVLEQDYAPVEIVVVNDGSTDNTEQVAQQFPSINYVSQTNQGLSAARNTGLQHSQGELLVFLDADDRLLPGALTSGYGRLQTTPTCAFVYGHYRFVDADGHPKPTWRETRTATPTTFTSGHYELIGPDDSVQRTWPQHKVDSDHYGAMLQRNVIVMHATILYQRWVFDKVGLFDTTLQACEDYDLYLRITRRFPVAAHEAVVAEYRLHGSNMTGSAVRMLTAVTNVMEQQRPFIQNHPFYTACHTAGLRHWQDYYGKQALRELPAQLLRLHSNTISTAQAGTGFLQRKLSGAADYGVYLLSSRLGGMAGAVQRKLTGKIQWGKLANSQNDKNLAADQSAAAHYTTEFLQTHSQNLQGTLLLDEAIALPDTASAQQVERLNGTTSSSPNTYDTIVLGACWMKSPDFIHTLPNLVNALRPGGVLLAALPGVVAPQGGWGMTPQAAVRLFSNHFKPEQVSVSARGNVQTATAVLHHLPTTKQTRATNDPQFPVIITVRAVKSD